MFYDFYELAGNELGITTDRLLDAIQSRPEEISRRIRSKPLSGIPCLLGNDLVLKGSKAAFISKGSDLWEHLEAYFQRLGRQAEFTSPPLIVPSERVNGYLVEKIGHQLGAIAEKLGAEEKTGRIYEQFQKLEDLKRVAERFGSIAGKYLSSEEMISGFLHAMTSSTGKDLVTESTRAAFIAMAVLRCHEEIAAPDNARIFQRIIEMGLTVLFQDVSHILSGSAHADEDQGHADESARIAESMGLSALAQETIRHHHRVVDADGQPILTNFRPSLEERVAVVTNAFLKCISETQFNLDPDQAIYVLEHYANRNVYDKMCVSALGKIGIGDRKYLILSKSFDYAKRCDKGETPFIWNISLDFPNRFICRNSACDHLSSEEVVLYQSIQFKGPVHNFEIPTGRYRKCQKITSQFNQWLLNTFFPNATRISGRN